MVFIRLSFFSLFLSFFSVTGFHTIYYNSQLSLILLENGISSFIDMSKNESIEEYENALNDVIALQDSNNTNIAQLFENIGNNLRQRIKKIKKLKNTKIDLEGLMKGLGYIGLGIGLTYPTYYFHVNFYKENRNEYARIIEYLESNGVIVRDIGNIYLSVPPRTSYKKEGKQLLELNKSASQLMEMEMCGVTLSLAAYFYGILEIAAALNYHNLHLNDKYLEKYKKMLAIVVKLREKYRKEIIFKNIYRT